MLKSTTFNEDEATELMVISASLDDFENTTRRVLLIDGGRTVLTAAASIDMLFIGANLATPFALPFQVVVEGGFVVVFDEIEPSPVAEFLEPDVNSSDKCEKVVESFSRDSISADSVDICIEASTKKAFSVKLTAEERIKYVEACETCFGYTVKQVRCKHKRKSLRGERVWCCHHKNQELEYRRYLAYGDRPEPCSWWEARL